MGASLNRVTLIGNLGADPEIRNTPNGSQVANFRVACSDSWKDQSGQKQERVEWINIVAWRKLAEISQKYLRKGMQVYVEGKLQTRSWEDKNGGGKKYATEVLADDIKMLGGRPESSADRRARDGERDTDDNYNGGFTPNTSSDDDLPF